MAKLGEFAIEHRFTQILAPTHLLQDAGDPWLARDIEASERLRALLWIGMVGKGIQLIYPLAIPYRASSEMVRSGEKVTLEGSDRSGLAQGRRIGLFEHADGRLQPISMRLRFS